MRKQIPRIHVTQLTQHDDSHEAICTVAALQVSTCILVAAQMPCHPVEPFIGRTPQRGLQIIPESKKKYLVATRQFRQTSQQHIGGDCFNQQWSPDCVESSFPLLATLQPKPQNHDQRKHQQYQQQRSYAYPKSNGSEGIRRCTEHQRGRWCAGRNCLALCDPRHS